MNHDLLWCVEVFLLKGNGEDAIFELGFHGAFVFLHLDWKSDGTRELAPVTFLDVPGSCVFVFAATQYSGNCQNIVRNSDVEVGLGNAGRARFDNKFIGGFIDIYSELSWKIVSIFPPIICPRI